MSDLLSFFRNKKILITGNTGFKGSWLSLILTHSGAEVHGFSKSAIRENDFSALVCKHGIKSQTFGDMADEQFLGQTIRRLAPDLVFHLAAQPLVSKSYEDPIETIQSNVVGMIALLEVMKDYSLPCKLIVVTSDKCYKISGKKEYSENDDLGGGDPYSASKAMQEKLVGSYHRNYFSKDSLIKCCTVRSGNVIGGGDLTLSRLIPDMIMAIEKNENILLRNPQAVRPWIHVLDTLSAYLTVAKALFEKEEISGESFNVGPDRDNMLNVKRLVDLFLKAYEREDVKAEQEAAQMYKESDFLFLSTEKIKTAFGWKCKLSMPAAIQETAAWYKIYHHNKPELLNFSLRQIETYFN